VNAKRLSGAAQGDLRDPERGGFPEHVARRSLTARQDGA